MSKEMQLLLSIVEVLHKHIPDFTTGRRRASASLYDIYSLTSVKFPCSLLKTLAITISFVFNLPLTGFVQPFVSI